MEITATNIEKYEGLDIADYFIKHIPFKTTIVDTPRQEPLFSYNIQETFVATSIKIANAVCENWNTEIDEMELFFRSTLLPVGSIQLNPCTTIVNVPLFINSHLLAVRANNGKPTFLPYLNRLQELKQYLLTTIVVLAETITVLLLIK